MKEHIDNLQSIKYVSDGITGILVWLTAMSIIPMIWWFWLWKITATLAVLTFLALLNNVGIASQIVEARKQKSTKQDADTNRTDTIPRHHHTEDEPLEY